MVANVHALNMVKAPTREYAVPLGFAYIGRQGIGYVIWVGSVGILALIVYAAQCGRSAFFSVVGVGIVVSGSALLLGGLLGFLFGIPRTVGGEQPNPPAAQESEKKDETPSSPTPTSFSARSYRPNTDLEQIADWLTKILVGVGLTQLMDVPKGLARLAAVLAPGLGGLDRAGSSIFAVGLALYFVLCGFLIGFLWTRLNMQQALRWADVAADTLSDISAKTDLVNAKMTDVEKRCDQAIEEVHSRKAQLDADDSAWKLAVQQLSPQSGLPEATVDQLYEAIKNASEVTQQKIYHEATMVRSSNWNVDRDLMGRTIPIFQAFIKLHPEIAEYHSELGLALKDKGDYNAAKQQFELAIGLRPKDQPREGAAWYEFLLAVCDIYLDQNFKKKVRSEDAPKHEIFEKLKIAWNSNSNLKRAMGMEGPVLTDWIDLNGLKDEFPGLSKAA